MKKHSLVLAIASVVAGLSACAVGQTSQTISPGADWRDTDGEILNAHGAGVLIHDGAYWLFGEHKTAGSNGNKANVGVRAYRSTDFVNWENMGVALAVIGEGEPGYETSDIPKGCVIERPKVVYNERTGLFVMWFHLELKGQGYTAARYGVAVATRPEGPYAFVRSGRVNAGVMPMNADAALVSLVERAQAGEETWPGDGGSKLEKTRSLFARDFAGGQMARDQTVFVDDDGTAYHIFASEENFTLHIAELDPSYTMHTGRYTRVLEAGHREAPAIAKRGDTYYLFTSGCTGWRSNPASYSVANSVFGPWRQVSNPCVGETPEGWGPGVTFDSQSTFVVEIMGKDDAFVFMADRWRPKNPIDGRYVWLPIEWRASGDGADEPVIRWRDSWDLSVFD